MMIITPPHENSVNELVWTADSPFYSVNPSSFPLSWLQDAPEAIWNLFEKKMKKIVVM